MPTTPQSYNNPYNANSIYDAVANVNSKKSPFTPYTGSPVLADQPAAPVRQPVVQPTASATVAPAVQPVAQPVAAEPVVAEPVQAQTQPVAEPTAGELFKDISIPTSQIGITSASDREKQYIDEITQPIDNDEIKQQAIAQMQAQIDATNKLYADELARARVEGAGRLGTTTAMGARRGLLGSDFGESQTRKTEDLNRQVERSIEQERLARVSALMNEANSTAAANIKERRAAMLAGFDARRAYAADEENRKEINIQKAVKNLIAQGVSPDKIQGGQLAQFAKAYGISTNDLTANYAEQKATIDAQEAQAQAEAQQQEFENQKTQAEINKINADIESGKVIKLGEGNLLVNLETGETFKNPKTFAPKSGGSGTLTPYQQFSATQSIAKDTQARTSTAREMTRQAQLITDSYDRIVNSPNKKARSLNTQAIITAFNKILDPTSVVRESEYDRVAGGQALVDQLRGKVDNVLAGGAGVTEATLKEAASIAEQYLTGAREHVSQQNIRAQDMARYFNLNPDFVTGSYGEPAPQEETEGLPQELTGEFQTNTDDPLNLFN